MPRPAGVNFFHYKHSSRRGLQENMTGFIVRQNPVIDLCIRYGLKATCKGMRPRAAESWKQQESKNRSLVGPREKIPLSRAERGVLCRDVEKRATCNDLQVARFRSDQCPGHGAWPNPSSEEKKRAGFPALSNQPLSMTAFMRTFFATSGLVFIIRASC